MRLAPVRLVRLFLFLIILLAVLALLAGGWSAWQSARGGQAWDPLQILARRDLAGRRIGIVAGHDGNDSGAVCPDGLTEAEVNRAIARVVSRRLQQRGARVDLLQEFDDRLDGYEADAFVSIHADSCEATLSGFKVASLEGGSVASEALVTCLWERYATATGLSPQPNTITYDMRRYHAFREIAPTTPAAIIETGFLANDRDLLYGNPERVAAGIVAGIDCFLNPNEGGTP